MDINSFIKERFYTDHDHWLNHLNFSMVLAIDKEHKHVPEWYGQLRVNKIIDYFINEGIIKKDNIKYVFLEGLGFEPVSVFHVQGTKNLQLSSVNMMGLSLAELTIISSILPSKDIKEEMTFRVSEPYYVDNNKLLQKYNLFCKV